MLPREYDPIAIKDYDAQIDKHALYGTMRKKGLSEELILSIQQFCRSKARGFPRDQRSAEQLLKLDKKIANVIYSLWLDGIMDFKDYSVISYKRHQDFKESFNKVRLKGLSDIFINEKE